MRSRTTRGSWLLFEELPADAQERARRSYRQFAVDPSHPGLQFKRVGKTRPVYSARVGIQYRALGLLEGDTVTWFWIGSHNEYERLLSR